MFMLQMTITMAKKQFGSHMTLIVQLEIDEQIGILTKEIQWINDMTVVLKLTTAGRS